MRRKRGRARLSTSRSATFALGLLLAAGGPGRPADETPPAVVALALDSSGSLSDAEIVRSRDLAGGILAALPAGSQIAVFSFDDQSRLLQPRTARADLVRRSLFNVRRAGRFTTLYDAIYDASLYVRNAPAERRAIVLLTDGNDENSAVTLEDSLRAAQDAHIPVFAVGMGAVQERLLRRIAKLTGGEYVAAGRTSGAALAERVKAVPATAAAPSAMPERRVARAAAPAAEERASVPAAAGAPVRADRGRWRAALWLVVVLVVAAAAALLTLRARRRARCATCGRELPDALSSCAFCARESEDGGATLRASLSPTVVERLNSTEEYLEKTVTLRERPVLTITRGPGLGELFELSHGTATSIGRARANDIVLLDISISGQHCRIRPENGGFVLHDLQSTNGTFVNDKRVSHHTLTDGDLVQVGETVMQFRTEHRRA